MLRLNDSWVWDSWYAFDGTCHHAFYLRASRGLGDPHRRHRYPSVGHAVSQDLLSWEVLPDALAVSDEPAFDDLTTWTGSVVSDDTGLWWMFYTGSSRAERGLVQRIGTATSIDLMVWTKQPASTVIEADPRWYERWGTAKWHDEAWRDPFVFRGEDGRWHMYITARANYGPIRERGVVGHAVSDDLRSWEICPPLTSPGHGFGQLEVTQVEVIQGTPTLVFSCGPTELDGKAIQRYSGVGGVFSVPASSIHGPFDIASAQRYPHDSLYAARLVRLHDEWQLIGFCNEVGNQFIGELMDPIAVTLSPERGLIPQVDGHNLSAGLKDPRARVGSEYGALGCTDRV